MKDNQTYDDTNTTFQSNAAMLMLGELKSFMLDHIKHLPKPWPKMSEAEQGAVIDSMDKKARDLINQCVYVISARGTKAKRMIVRKAVADETQQPYKVALTAQSAMDLLDIMSHIGTDILVVLPQDVEEYLQGGENIQPDPDQRPLDIDGTVAADISEAQAPQPPVSGLLPYATDETEQAQLPPPDNAVDAEYTDVEGPADTIEEQAQWFIDRGEEPMPPVELSDTAQAEYVSGEKDLAKELRRGALQVVKARCETGLLSTVTLYFLLDREVKRKDQRPTWRAYLTEEWLRRSNK